MEPAAARATSPLRPQHRDIMTLKIHDTLAREKLTSFPPIPRG
jgi:hypothetical protein